MQSLKFYVVALSLGIGLLVAGCHESSGPINSSGASTLRLSSNSIVLSGSETSKSVEASLTCGCAFMMENMVSWGDTSCIHFNKSDLSTSRNQQSIVATADPAKATGAHMSACLSFRVNDRMMGTTCMDTVRVEYYK